MRNGFEVQKTMCATCIYRPDSPLNLKHLEREALKRDSYRQCHHSKTACCNGFWSKHKNNFNLGRIAQRLGVVTFVQHDVL